MSPPRSAASGRRDLTADAIIDAALRVIDAEGLNDLTMRRLGKELRVDPTAMYRHFRDKDSLLAAVADRILVGLADSLPSPEDGWRETVRGSCLAAWETFEAHPRFAAVLATSPDTLGGQVRIAEVFLGALREAGLDDQTAALSFAVLSNYTAGHASLQADPRQEFRSPDSMRRGYAMLSEDEYPNCVELAPYLFTDPKAQFEFGLDLLLDGFERLAAAQASDTPA